MALFTPSASPNITVKEIDLTGVVPSVTTSTGAFVGEFSWGPVQEATLIDNEATLVSTFGSPTTDNSVDFLSAASFLRYSTNMYVVREVDDSDLGGAKNAYDATTLTLGEADRPLVKNADDFDAQKGTLDTSGTLGHTFISKYPGAAGSSLEVQLCPHDAADASFTNWAYKSYFDAAPGTSTYASDAGGSNDELHVIVVDKQGTLTGTPGAVLETFPFLSAASDAKTNDGTNNNAIDVINNRSEYVWCVDLNQDSDTADDSYLKNTTAAGSGGTGTNFILSDTGVKTFTMANGQDGRDLTTAEYATGFDQFESTEDIQVDFLIAPGMSSSGDQATVVNDLTGIAGSTRKDCVVVTSPNRGAIINATPANAVTNAVATVDTFTASSYLIVDNNYLKVYDKYNDEYVFIPAASSTAGLMAATDAVAAPWFSPAGNRRGQYFGVTSLAYSANKSQRDTLYKAGINPIVNLPGQGVILFGDKTKESRPSAFDRINVRRLFLAIERAIARAARNVMFEFNDEFTRAEFVNIVEPFLREIQGRRGITDFRVVCDETNNTAAVVDRNEFVCSVFVKPARSINYITLNFVAVRTGVEFSEVVGTV